MSRIIFYYCLTSIILLWGCSASTGTRYEEIEKTNDEIKVNEVEAENIQEAEFDLTPYRTEIAVENSYPLSGEPFKDVWYGYSDTSETKNKNITGTTDGYRVQVLSTDDLEAANQMRSDIYFTLNKDVYVNFEPPFYKVKVGDFTSRTEANDFKFKLNQLGYSEARVVQETVNIFE